MKKISANQQETRQTIARQRTEQARERIRAYQKSKLAFGARRVFHGYFDSKTKRQIIAIPENLDLGIHRNETLAVAQGCRENVFHNRRRTVLDFSETKKISSEAVLVLVAEIDRCRRFAGSRMLTGTYPKDKKLHRQMRDSGFFEALHVKSHIEGEERTFPLEYIKVVSGNQADGRLARGLRMKLLGPYDASVPAAAKSSFFRSLSEAMTNVSQHAYPEDMTRAKIRIIPKGWWMLGHINKVRRELKVMIVDQGIGIPRSLPKKYSWELILSVLSLLGVIKPTDDQMILAAMEVGRSRMGEDHRGKGLNDLKKLIQSCGKGSLRILSNRGEYLYTEGGREVLRSHDVSIHGTFVEWTVPLDAILPVLKEEEHESY